MRLDQSTLASQDVRASLPVACSRSSGWKLHRRLFVAFGLTLLALAATGLRLNPIDAPLLAGLVILFLGVPHGAFDVALWQHRQPASGALRKMLAFYLLLAGGFFGLWLIAPELALPVFLAISIYHFSSDWGRDLDLAPRLIVASAMLTAPAGLFREDVTQIFMWLAPQDAAQLTAFVMASLSVPLAQASAVVVAVLLASRNLWAAAEVTVVVALAWLTPPLLFFLIYFCGLHSVRHVIQTRETLRTCSLVDFALKAFPYAPIAIIGTLAGFIVLSNLPPGPAILGAIFMALGALTVPHILIVDRAEDR